MFEIWNPHQAKRVQEANLDISTTLSCRISVYEKEAAQSLPLSSSRQ